MSNLEKLNHEQRLYVIKAGKGFSCLGFDVCEDWTKKVLSWLGDDFLGIPQKGTVEAYEYYRNTMNRGAYFSKQTNQRCPALLIPQLTGLENKRVEVLDCYGEVRRFWVGKSTGWLPIHLEIKKSNSMGGGAAYGTPYQRVYEIVNGQKRLISSFPLSRVS